MIKNIHIQVSLFQQEVIKRHTLSLTHTHFFYSRVITKINYNNDNEQVCENIACKNYIPFEQNCGRDKQLCHHHHIFTNHRNSNLFAWLTLHFCRVYLNSLSDRCCCVPRFRLQNITLVSLLPSRMYRYGCAKSHTFNAANKNAWAPPLKIQGKPALICMSNILRIRLKI